MGGRVGRNCGSARGRGRVALAVLAAASIAAGTTGATTAAGGAETTTPACPAQVEWSTAGFDAARTGLNPCETALGVASAPGMHLLWSAKLMGPSVAQPTYAQLTLNGTLRRLVFAADEHGYVEALDAGTGALVWKKYVGAYQSTCQDMPGGAFGASGAPVFDAGSSTGYVLGGLGQMYALDLTTGATLPGWPLTLVDPTVDHDYGSLTLSNGIAYATTASYCDQGTYYGKVIAVNTSLHQVAATWDVVDPNANPGATGGGIWGPGGVSIDTANGAMYAATGNSGPVSENAGYAEQIVRLDSSLHVQAANYTALVGGDVDYGATPVLFQPPSCPPMLATENKSGVLVVYGRDTIASGPMQKIQVSSTSAGAFIGDPAYSPTTKMLYVANPATTDDGTFTPGLIAFSVQADCTLAVAWEQTFGFSGPPMSSPTIANGVVYEADGFDHTLWAFNAQTGAHLWDSGTTNADTLLSAPTVVDGTVYVATFDGSIEAFGTGASNGLPGAPSIVSATPGVRRISVSYTAPVFNGGSAIVSYRATCVSSDGGVTKSSPLGLLNPLVVGSLSAGHTYRCSVVAKNATGFGPASALSPAVWVPRPPDAPTGASAIPGIRRISVTYTPSANNGGSPILGYRAKCVSSDGGVTRSSPYGLTTPLVVTALSSAHTYTCTVVAKNIAGISPASAPSLPMLVQ